MRSTRREDLYVADIIEAAEAIERFIDGVTLEEFVGNDMLRSAVLNKLQIIGGTPRPMTCRQSPQRSGPSCARAKGLADPPARGA